MKKIWICGASGMLGSHFKRFLKDQRITLANESNRVDITQLDAVSDFIRHQKVTHVINCAAYTQVDKAEAEQKQAYLVNAIGPHHLALACRRHGAKLTHFSTDYVFDGKVSAPYTEDHLCSPLGAYGLSKLAGEMKLLDELPEACVIRTSWLYGYPGKNFVDTMLRLMKEKEEIRIVQDQVGRPTYCQDLVEATIDLIDLEKEGIYHFANSNETSWYQFAKEIYKQASELEFSLKIKQIIPITTQEYLTAAKRPAYSTLSTKKWEHAIGKTPRPWGVALRDYLKECRL